MSGCHTPIATQSEGDASEAVAQERTEDADARARFATQEEVANYIGGDVDPEDGKTLLIIGDSQFGLTLTSNPTTGYFWDCNVLQDTDKFVIEDETYQADPAPEGLVGSGGKQFFFIRTHAPAEGEMHCTYARGPEDVADTRTFKLVSKKRAQ